MLQQGVAPTAITYNAMITAYEKGNSLITACENVEQPELARDIFAAMEQQGMVPHAIAYNALISACEKSKQPEQALVVCVAMELICVCS